jgi:tRNA(Ile)-lysidine synthase TilS/MesJ
MVIATVLKRLFPEREIIGVHVNYCNRTDSHEEEAFARTWAFVLGIKYCVRHIREFQRQKAKDIDIRGTYESYTRDVRFASYTFAWQAKHQAPHVILGHHEDDTFENILTNIAHAEKYECLYGMLPVAECESKLGQIVFHRPLLRVSKDAIYQLARAWGIPYLQNSTLAETQRGLIRDVVRPTLESWNPLFPRRMLEFADVVSEFAAAFEKQVESAVLETRALNDTTYVWTVALNARQHSSLTSTRFWRRYFHALLHTTASWRSLDALCELIARKDKVRVMLTNHICIRIACTNLKTSVTITKG